MEQYKKDFIEFMIDCQVLKFGDFVTKSGRKTPFFVNTGFYRTGSQLRKLGEYYAQAIQSAFGLDFDVLFGPAYKGIPLSVTTSIALSEKYGADIRYCSNRKEIKDHGDKGILLGGPVGSGDKVVIIEDVTTAGTSIEETLPILRAQGDLKILGLVESVDRIELGQGEKSALNEISDKYGLKTFAIVTMKEV
ncbi:MAG: orotate phosphoribosyltransferase, partial [Lentisphaeria bacterium]|nr:orotate phosphoribosyltransferase [Lentisphaeria bacterium]